MTNKKGLSLAWCLVLFGMLVASSSSQAQLAQCEQDTPGTTYYYGNGILTTFLEAAVSMNALNRELSSEGVAQQGDFFKLAYNRTDGIVVDLVESLVQDLQTTYSQVLRLLTDALPEQAQQQVIDAVGGFDHTLILGNEVTRHVLQYKSDVLAGNKVVVVAHSQGNFFVNLAWEELTEQEQASTGIVSVANPDSGVGANSCLEFEVDVGPPPFDVLACAASLPELEYQTCSPEKPLYTTACTDLVITGLRALYGAIDGSGTFNYLPRALNPNTDSVFSSDWSGHGFVTSYLYRQSPTRNQIVAQARDVGDTLDAPTVQGDLSIQGVVTDETFGLPIINARAKVELIADTDSDETLFDAVVDDYTDTAGIYSLCVPSDLIPNNFLISASRDGFIPDVQDVAKDGSGFQTVDFVLTQHHERFVALELDPTVHHLGNDNHSGTINSQFQKKAEGLSLDLVFRMTERQRTATDGKIWLAVKGAQIDNPVYVNDQLIGYLNWSPEDGSFGSIEFEVPFEVLVSMSDLNTLRIESANTGGLFGDYDDFEFANIILSLTLP